MAKTPTSSPVEFGTDEWGKWATSMQDRMAAVEAELARTNVPSMSDLDNVATAMREELKAATMQPANGEKFATVEQLDAMRKELSAKKAKSSAATGDDRTGSGDDMSERLRVLEQMNGIRPKQEESDDGADGA